MRGRKNLASYGPDGTVKFSVCGGIVLVLWKQCGTMQKASSSWRIQKS